MELAYVYNRHGEALEYDMFAIWHVDINTVSVRRMLNFYQRIPMFSQTKMDISEVPYETREWNVNSWLLANVIDVLQSVDYGIKASFSKHAPKPPKPFPRPKMVKQIRPPAKKVWPGKTNYVGAKKE